MLLLLYPTRLFKECLNCCGFRRWDILLVVIDIFQGWYKDGIEGTQDFRSVSALYFLSRIVLTCLYILAIFYTFNNNFRWYIVGLSHVFLGVFFFVAKPYKKNWINYIDGLLILWIGVLVYVNIYFDIVKLVFSILFGPVLFFLLLIFKFLIDKVIYGRIYAL